MSQNFIFGLHREKGCQGKKSSCQEFHPVLCRDLVKDGCSNTNCDKGFHLRCMMKRKKSSPDDEPNKTDSVENKKKKLEAELKALESDKNSEPSKVKSNAKDDFLDAILKSL